MELIKDKLMHILITMVIITIVYLSSMTIILLNIVRDLNKSENVTVVYIVQPEVAKTEEVVKVPPKPEVKSAVVETKETPKPVVAKKEVVKPTPNPEVKTKPVKETHIHPHPHEHKEESKSKVIPKKVEPKAKTERTNGDAYLLAQIINAEAKGEPYNGKVAVGNVIMNRVSSSQFPDTIKGVVYQKGQFYPVTSGSINAKPSQESINAAKEVLNGKQIVGKQALYFYNPNTSTSDWIFSRKTIMDIGNHRFAY